MGLPKVGLVLAIAVAKVLAGSVLVWLALRLLSRWLRQFNLSSTWPHAGQLFVPY